MSNEKCTVKQPNRAKQAPGKGKKEDKNGQKTPRKAGFRHVKHRYLHSERSPFAR